MKNKHKYFMLTNFSLQVGLVEITVTPFYASNESAAAVDQVIDFSFSLINKGLLSLFNMTMQSEYLESRGSTVTCTGSSGVQTAGGFSGAVYGMSSYPDQGLVPGQTITCKGSVSVLQTEVRYIFQCFFGALQGRTFRFASKNRELRE